VIRTADDHVRLCLSLQDNVSLIQGSSMNLRTQCLGAGLLAIAAGLSGVAAVSTAAVAAPAPVSAQTNQASEVISNLALSNLSKHTIDVPPGPVKRDVLELINGAQEMPGKKYFLVNSATGQLGGGFIRGGIRVSTVDTWQEVVFTPPQRGSRQVRYGDPANIANAAIIASVTVQTYWSTNMVFDTQTSLFGWHLVNVLKIAQDPMVSEPGEFYAYDPIKKAESAFVANGEVLYPVTPDWRGAHILPPDGSIEIRFGTPGQHQETDRVVAKATKI
jgi:hypothetical protein